MNDVRYPDSLLRFLHNFGIRNGDSNTFRGPHPIPTRNLLKFDEAVFI